jgi:mono/diheme cytochrome c family protein
MRSRLLILAVMLVSASSAASAESRSQRGAIVFNESGCRHCHTIRNVGGKKGPDLSSAGRILTKDRMRQQIIQGGAQMPAFGDALDEQELANLLAYLHSCRDKKKKGN